MRAFPPRARIKRRAGEPAQGLIGSRQARRAGELTMPAIGENTKRAAALLGIPVATLEATLAVRHRRPIL